jgi:hypothetical protein
LQTKLQQQNRLRDCTDELVKRSLHKLIELLESELETLEQDIQAELQAQSTTKNNLALLDSVKGIGLLTAAKLLCEMPNLAEYESAKAAGADVGLSPCTGSRIERRVEAEPAPDRRPAQIALFLPHDDYGQHKQPDQTEHNQHYSGDARSKRIRVEIGRQSGEDNPTEDPHRDGSKSPDAKDSGQ